MTTEYLNNVNEIVFLNSKNIAQERDASIPYNAIPSLSLVNKLYDDIALSASNVSTDIENLRAIDQYLSADTLDAAKIYANSLSTSLSATVPAELKTAIETLSISLSGTVDSKRNKAIEDLSTSLSTTVKNANYAVYNSLSIGYNKDTHDLAVEIKDIDGNIHTKSLNADIFVKNKVVHHMSVIDGQLVIFWEAGDDVSTGVSIPLTQLAQVYDPGIGITITLADAFTIAVDFNTVAKKDDLATLSGTVNVIKDTTIPGLTATVNTLSTTIHNSITGDIATISSEVVAYNDTDKLAGKVKALSSNVLTLSTELTNEFLLSADAVDLIYGTLIEKVNENNAQITANAENIAELKSYATTLSAPTTGTIAVLSTKIDNAVENSSKALASADFILGSTGPIANIEIAQATIDGRIQGLSTLTNAHTATLGIHNFNINQNSTNIDELSASARNWDTALNDALSGEIISLSNKLSGEVETLSGRVDALSGNLSTDINNLSTSLSTTVSLDISSLSTAIDKKIYINNISADSLSVEAYVSQDYYHNKLTAGTLDSNVIYVVSSDTFNMYDEKIINLADAENRNDAVNMHVLSSMANSLSSELKLAILNSLASLDAATTIDDIKNVLRNLSAAML